MRRISSNLLFTISSPPIKQGYILLDDTGMLAGYGILEKETESTEYYCGILCPCFKEEDTDAVMKKIISDQGMHPELDLQEILARYCSMPGEKKGFLLLERIDWTNRKITDKTTVRRLL